jgi:hypothetical protein
MGASAWLAAKITDTHEIRNIVAILAATGLLLLATTILTWIVARRLRK